MIRLFLIIVAAGFFTAWAAQAAEKAGPAKKPKTTVTCKGKMDVDYKKNKAEFYDDVVVNDPQMKMTADKMTVYFASKTKAIHKIIATGNVKFKKDDRSAKSGKAVYTAEDGKVVLTGDPMVKKGMDIVQGEVITFYRDDSRMLVEPTAKLILYSSDDKDVQSGWL